MSHLASLCGRIDFGINKLLFIFNILDSGINLKKAAKYNKEEEYQVIVSYAFSVAKPARVANCHQARVLAVNDTWVINIRLFGNRKL